MWRFRWPVSLGVFASYHEATKRRRKRSEMAGARAGLTWRIVEWGWRSVASGCADMSNLENQDDPHLLQYGRTAKLGWRYTPLLLFAISAAACGVRCAWTICSTDGSGVLSQREAWLIAAIALLILVAVATTGLGLSISVRDPLHQRLAPRHWLAHAFAGSLYGVALVLPAAIEACRAGRNGNGPQGSTWWVYASLAVWIAGPVASSLVLWTRGVEGTTKRTV